MAEHIHKCIPEKIYTLEDECPSCGKRTVLPKPPKFSLNDKYAGMRREIRRKELHKYVLTAG